MHFTFFDEDIGVNLDNKSTYWKISFSAVTNSTSLSRSSIGTVWTLVFNWTIFFHLVSRGKKIAHKIYRFSKHVVIFSDYFQVCISWKKKGVVRIYLWVKDWDELLLKFFTEKWFIKYFLSWLLLLILHYSLRYS